MSYMPPPDWTFPTDPNKWIIILIDRVVQFRFPRSKRLRTRVKWASHPRNFRPLAPVVCTFMGHGQVIRPNYLELHTDTWLYAARKNPEWAARCEVYRRTWPGEGWRAYKDVPFAPAG